MCRTLAALSAGLCAGEETIPAGVGQRLSFAKQEMPGDPQPLLLGKVPGAEAKPSPSHTAPSLPANPTLPSLAVPSDGSHESLAEI